MTRPVLRALGATAAVGAACFGWGLVEAAQFTVRRVDLPILPAGGKPLRILHVSDETGGYRSSEMEEVYMYMFFIVYLLSLGYRRKLHNATAV